MSGSEEIESARLLVNGREALEMGRDEVQRCQVFWSDV
jgi:hypothetical protein